MSERRHEPGRERDGDRRATTGPFGTMLGATLGPVGAAVGSVVDETRVAFTFSFGTGMGRSDDDSGRLDDGLDDPATIEIENTGDAEGVGLTSENEENGGREGGTDGENAA